jgi:anti-sigma factor RsiW
MNCGQFRQFYSDFTDGLLDETEEVAFHVHMAECVECRRFDAALEQGRHALQGIEAPAATGDFESRLYDRILREGGPEPEPVLRQWSGMAGAMLVLAMVSVMGWNAREAFKAPRPAPFRAAGSAGLGRRMSDVPVSVDSAVRSLGSIPVLRLPRDSEAAAARRAKGIEVSNDWMVP